MTVTISIISTTKPASSIFSLTRHAEVAARDAFERHDEDVAAVEHRDRHQVEQAEIQADDGHQAEERESSPSCADSPDSCAIADRAHQLFRRRLAGEQAPDGLEDQSGALDVAFCDAQPHGLERRRA